MDLQLAKMNGCITRREYYSRVNKDEYLEDIALATTKEDGWPSGL